MYGFDHSHAGTYRGEDGRVWKVTAVKDDCPQSPRAAWADCNASKIVLDERCGLVADGVRDRDPLMRAVADEIGCEAFCEHFETPRGHGLPVASLDEEGLWTVQLAGGSREDSLTDEEAAALIRDEAGWLGLDGPLREMGLYVRPVCYNDYLNDFWLGPGPRYVTGGDYSCGVAYVTEEAALDQAPHEPWADTAESTLRCEVAEYALYVAGCAWGVTVEVLEGDEWADAGLDCWGILVSEDDYDEGDDPRKLLSLVGDDFLDGAVEVEVEERVKVLVAA